MELWVEVMDLQKSNLYILLRFVLHSFGGAVSCHLPVAGSSVCGPKSF